MKIVTRILFLICTPLILHSADDAKPARKKPDLNVCIPFSRIDRDGEVYVQDFTYSSSIKPQMVVWPRSKRPHDLEKPEHPHVKYFIADSKLRKHGFRMHSLTATQAAPPISIAPISTQRPFTISPLILTRNAFDISAASAPSSAHRTHFTLPKFSESPSESPVEIQRAFDSEEYLWISASGRIRSMRVSTPIPFEITPLSLLKRSPDHRTISTYTATDESSSEE